MKANVRERILTRSLLLGIFAVIALIIANIFVAQDSSRDQHNATDRVLYTLDVLGQLDAMSSLLAEAEVAQRSFILLNDDDYLAPYTEATNGVELRLDSLQKLIADNSPQSARVRQLRELVRERIRQMDESLLVSKEQGLMAARQDVARNRHKATAIEIREAIAALKGTESGVLAKQLRNSDKTFLRARSISFVAGALGLLALGAFVFLVDRNLRARDAAAAEIARQRETLRVTLASIGDGVITTDTSGRVVFLNGEAETLTGWKSDDAKGKPLARVFRIVSEETRQPVENPAARALRDGMVVGPGNHSLLIGRDGAERPIDDCAAPIRDLDDRVAGVVLVFRDVTEDRASTNQLRKLATELSEADRRKNEFLAMLAHEIRNPLAAIRNSVAVLKLAGRAAETSVAAQETIDRQMAHLVRLVEDLLDVSRISRGRLALRQSRIDLRQALDQAIEASRSICTDNEQALDVEVPDTPLYVNGDATRITQAIGNLLSNACKFTPRGGRIQLSVGIENGHAIVCIRDNGIGIAREHLSGLFDMFSQIDTSLERAQGGLGIGLNLVKQLVEMHGGRVEARSDGVGSGSEFIVHFPLLTAAEEALIQSAANAAIPATVNVASAQEASVAVAPTPPRRRRILVVDDNEDSADSLAMLLRLQGHEAHIARDGLEAVEMALRTQPEVVLLDIGLPKLNGYEAARRIRLSPGGKSMRFVALTGWGQEEDRKLSAAAGFDEHLVKPVDNDLLVAILAKSWSAEKES